MIKKCKSCGTQVNLEDVFCTKCGSTEFVVENDYSATPQAPVTQPFAPTQQPVQYYRNNNMPNTQPAPSKGNNKGLIAIIIVLAVLLVGVIGVFVVKTLKDGKDDSKTTGNTKESTEYVATGNNTDKESSTVETTAPSVAYTKGTFDGKTYTNRWIGITADLPYGYTNADSNVYASGENENTDCAVYWIADDSLGFIIMSIEKLPENEMYSEAEYMDILVDIFMQQGQASYDFSAPYTRKYIAGQSYLVAESPFTNSYGSFHQSLYVKEKDGRMIVFTFLGTSEQANNEMVRIFQSAY